MAQQSLEEFIKQWNLRYPYDRFYRKKYNIGFGSPQHKLLNFVDMALDLKEDLLFTPKERGRADNAEREEFTAQTGLEYEAGENQDAPLTEQEIDYAYQNLNLEEFNDK